MTKRHRIVLAKMGLDCHDTGIVIVAQLLRDHGFEVIYLGLHNSADAVVKAALQENADAIGISFLSGQHMTQVRLLIEAMARQRMQVPVFCGGVVPREDAAELQKMGVAEVFFPGTLGPEVVARVSGVLDRGRAA
ncbi:MAG TPA: methylmalonyl-CoA mutase [Rhodospirillaceae bacterium]|nr:methylmalonyl-CoA mutase [Rhodospirillaceae bacterium]